MCSVITESNQGIKVSDSIKMMSGVMQWVRCKSIYANLGYVCGQCFLFHLFTIPLFIMIIFSANPQVRGESFHQNNGWWLPRCDECDETLTWMR